MQKMTFPLSAILFISVLSWNCSSGLVTTGNRCYDQIQKGKEEQKKGNYNMALDLFNQVLKNCKAFDAKENGLAGKAAAHNGLRQFTEALAAANGGLKINGNNIDLLFEKAKAEMGLGNDVDAKSDLNKIIDLTSHNQNVKERAGIFAKMAEIDLKYKGYAEAANNVKLAIQTDPSNTAWYMMLGDIHAADQNYTEALAGYDAAIAKGKDDAEAWKAKAATAIKLYQKKYNVPNADQMVKSISGNDKQTLCSVIKTAQEKSVRDVNMDLFGAFLCK